MYALGAYAMAGNRAVAVVLGGTVAVLLHFKAELHGARDAPRRGELRAVMQFVLLALVVLPVLPDATFGPYAVFNPREMWLMAVLIVGLSLAGYIALKFFGERAGIVAGGLLGGLISSTATTVSWSRLTRGRPEAARAAALVIVIASTVVYGRVLVEIAAMARPFLAAACRPSWRWPPPWPSRAAVLWLRTRGDAAVRADGQQPADLKTAFTFAALYVVVLLAVAFVNDRFGARPLRRQHDLRPHRRGRHHAVGLAPGRIAPGRRRTGVAARGRGAAVEPRVQGRAGGPARRPRACGGSSCWSSGCRLLARRPPCYAFWPS